jgi:hypothetical protein
MAPAITIPSSVQAVNSTIPITTTGHVPDASTGPFAVTARTAATPTIMNDPLQFNNHSLRSVQSASQPTPSQVTIDPTPVSFDLDLTLQSTSTVEGVRAQLEQQKVSIPNATAVVFTDSDGNVTSTANEGAEGQKLNSLALDVPTTGWVKSVSIKVAGLAGAGLMWCFKTFIIVRVKGFFLRQIGETIGRTIIWGAERVGQIRQGRRGGLLGRSPLDTGVNGRTVF